MPENIRVNSITLMAMQKMATSSMLMLMMIVWVDGNVDVDTNVTKISTGDVFPFSYIAAINLLHVCASPFGY
jgi:hypothetical protein